VNAFGFGGSNTHVVLDDAKGYLASKSITGHYSGARKTHTSTNGIQTNGIQTNGTKVNGIQTNGYHTNGYKSNGFHKEKEEPYILSWSAHDELALQRMTADFSKHLQRGCDEPYLQQLAYTLSCRRNVFGWRSFAVVRSVEDLSQLEQLASPRIRAGRDQGAVFVFTGQGAQYQNMGVELLHWKVFRESLESFDDSLTRLGCTWSVFG
jgi:acyl transferase domain-containing protein